MMQISPEEKETVWSLQRALALVLVPGLLFVIGLIYFVAPPRASLSLANGCYQIPGGPLIEIRRTKMKINYFGLEDRVVAVTHGKQGLQIEVDRGTIFTTGSDGRVRPSNGQWANTLLPLILQSNKPPVLTIAADEATLTAPKVDCRSALSNSR